MRRRVPATGVRAWIDPDPAAIEVDPIEGGSDVELLEQREDGWARIRSPHGPVVWVNGTVLLQAEPPADVTAASAPPPTVTPPTVTPPIVTATTVTPATTTAGTVTATTADVPERTHRRRRLLVVAAVALLVGGGAAALLLLSDSDDPDTSSATPTPPVATTAAPVDDDEVAAPTTAAEPATPPSTSPPSTTTSPAPEIDPTIGWRWIHPAQFSEAGHQQANAVVTLESTLIAAGVSETFEPVPHAVPLPDGGTVTLLDWQITVSGVQLDAAETIAAFDPENEPAPEGVQYLLIDLEVTNLGNEGTRNVWSDVDMFLAAPDGMPLTRDAYCDSILTDRFRSGPFDPGATNVGTACFSMLAVEVRDDMVIGFAPAETPRGQTDAAVWTSIDGETWQRVEVPALAGPGDQAISQLVVVDGIAYAGGTVAEGAVDDGSAAGRDIAIWRSTDGAVWDRLDVPALAGPGEQVLHDLRELDGTLVAAGSDTPPLAAGEDTAGWEPDFHDLLLRQVQTRAALWTSADGAEWSAVDLGSAGRSLATVDAVTSHGGTTSLVGHHIDGDLAVLTSGDLAEWEAAPLEAADTTWWFPTATATLGDRVLVLGTPGALSSADGATWELGTALSVRDAVPVGDVLLGVGRSGGHSIVGPLYVDGSRPMLSVIHHDGSWSSVRSADLVPAETVGELLGVTAFGDHFVAVGRTAGNGDDAAVWLGGGVAGSDTAELYDHDPSPPGPPPDLPMEPTADLVHFDGAAWSVLDTGDDLSEEMASDIGAFDLVARHLTRDGAGNLWVASWAGGVFRFDTDGWTRFDRSHGLPSIQVTDMETDAAGTVWVGTAAGPAFFDGERWTASPLPPTIAHASVTELAIAADGTLWASCLGGLAAWDGNGWTAFTRDDGLPSSVVSDVQPGLGGVWAVTPAGLAHFDGTTWTPFADEAHRPYFEAYPYVSPLDSAVYFSPGLPVNPDVYRSDLIRLQPDGISQVLMNGSTYKSTALSPEGTLYVATDINGLFVIGAGVDNVDSIEGVRLLHLGDTWTAPNGEVWMDASQGLFQIHSVGLVTRHTDIPGLGYQLIAPDQGFQDGGVADLVFGPDGDVWALMHPQ